MAPGSKISLILGRVMVVHSNVAIAMRSLNFVPDETCAYHRRPT